MATYILSGARPMPIPGGQGMRVVAQLQGRADVRVNIRATSTDHRPQQNIAKMLPNGELFVFPPPVGAETIVSVAPSTGTNFAPDSMLMAELIIGATNDRDPTQIQVRPMSVGGFAGFQLIRIVNSPGAEVMVFGPAPPPPPLPQLARAAMETGREWMARSGRPDTFGRRVSVVVDGSASMGRCGRELAAALDILAGVYVAVGGGTTLSAVLVASHLDVVPAIGVGELRTTMIGKVAASRTVIGLPMGQAIELAGGPDGRRIVVISDGVPPDEALDRSDVRILCLASDPVFAMLRGARRLRGVALPPGPPDGDVDRGYLSDRPRLESAVGRLVDMVFSEGAVA